MHLQLLLNTFFKRRYLSKTPNFEYPFTICFFYYWVLTAESCFLYTVKVDVITYIRLQNKIKCSGYLSEGLREGVFYVLYYYLVLGFFIKRSFPETEEKLLANCFSPRSCIRLLVLICSIDSGHFIFSICLLTVKCPSLHLFRAFRGWVHIPKFKQIYWIIRSVIKQACAFPLFISTNLKVHFHC